MTGLSGERALYPILLSALLVMTGTGMVYPLLAPAAHHLGGGHGAAGLLLAVFASFRLVANLPAGLAADRFGRPVVMATGFLLASAGALAAWRTTSIPILAFLVGIIGCGASVTLTGALAAIADHTTLANRGRLMSRYQTAVLVGLSIGPALGGLVSGRYGMLTPFLVQGCTSLMALVLLALPALRRGGFAPSPLASATAAGRTEAAGWRSVLSVSFVTIAFVGFAMFMARTATQWQLVPLILRERFAYTPEGTGLLLSASGLANLATQFVVGRVIDGWGTARTAMLGGAGMVLGLALMMLDGYVSAIWASTIFLAFATGMASPAVTAFAIETSTAPHGATLGALRTVSDAGLVLGPAILGLLLTLPGFSYRTGTMLSVLIMLVAMTTFVAANRRALFRERAKPDA